MATPMERPLRASIGIVPQTPRLVRGLTIEPSQRRVRAFFGGVPVVDSRRALLVFEPGHHPIYWFPRKDVHADLPQSADIDSTAQPPVERWTLRVGDRVAQRAAWSYPKPQGERAPLKDHLAFEWDTLDAWFEEATRPSATPATPTIASTPCAARARAGRSRGPGGRRDQPALPAVRDRVPVRYYIPKLDARLELLEPSAKTTRCPYKGVAVYWSLRVNGRLFPDLVWSYPQPIPECPKIEDLLCFWNERTDTIVDGEPEERPVTPWS